MADKETTELTAASGLGGTELFHIVDASGNSRKLTLAQLKTFINTDPSVVPSTEPWRGAQVRRTTALATTSGTAAKVTWHAATVDTDSLWSAGAPTRLTVPPGVTKVRLSANVDWASGAAGSRVALFYKNGANGFNGNAYEQQVPNITSTIRQNIASGILTVVAGDYFELEVFQNSGSYNVNSGSLTWFEMEIVEG